jgi:uncharacterized protein YigE (DUF2233 family)
MFNRKLKKYFALIFLAIIIFAFATTNPDNDSFISYRADLKKQELKLYWKDDKGQPLKSIQRLKELVESKQQQLLFAMNAGMYMTDNTPLGLFIQNGKTIKPLNKRSGTGNFYLKPNGVFYIDSENNPAICTTEKFIDNGKIKFATQSGPMLVINGEIHSVFEQGSKNVNIRNGVGVLPNNKLLFAMSKKEINFYDFANYFKKAGCTNALYLDGFVCRSFLPEKNWVQLDGNFGVMIGVTKSR